MLHPLAKLRDQIIGHFNLTELRNLAFDLGISHEELSGEAISDKARELVAYCERRGLVSELVNRCRKLRPYLKWNNLNKKTLVLDPFCGIGGLLIETLPAFSLSQVKICLTVS